MIKNMFWTLIIVSSFLGCLIKFGIFEGELRLYQFLYFTTLSNIIVILYYVGAFKYEFIMKNSFFRGVMSISIFVTFLIYNFCLKDSSFGTIEVFSLQWIGSTLLHYVTPFLVAVDFVLFSRNINFNLLDPIKWLSFPALYFVFIVFMAKIKNFFPNQSTPYPYYFIDVVSLGWVNVFRNILFVAILFAAVGYVIYIVNYILSNKI